MLEIFVCDDDVRVTEYIKSFILKSFNYNCKVITVNRCRELISIVEIDERVPDILIMDINLADGNGIETVKRLQNQHSGLRVIYLTGVIDYATEIFESRPSYFLLKPIDDSHLFDALSKVSRELEYDRADSVVIKTNGSESVIHRRDIMYVESKGRKLTLYMQNGKKNEIYEKMDVLQQRLGASFVRSHKSFLINMKYITERTNKEFYLSDGKVIPISKSNLKEVKIKFISYLGEA